jgi:hypothetical protein
VIKEQVTEEKTRMKKFIQDGVIKYARVEVTAEDIIEQKDLEIKHSHELIDSLRQNLEILEDQQKEKPSSSVVNTIAPASSYQCYK